MGSIFNQDYLKRVRNLSFQNPLQGFSTVLGGLFTQTDIVRSYEKDSGYTLHRHGTDTGYFSSPDQAEPRL